MAISVKNLSKTYRGKDTPAVEALKGVTFALPSAGLVFILGKSGCGKTTLMNMIGGLDSFDGGDLTIDGRSVKSFSDGELVEYRNRQVGFIYQENNLLDEYTVERNVGMALALQGKKDYKEEVARAFGGRAGRMCQGKTESPFWRAKTTRCDRPRHREAAEDPPLRRADRLARRGDGRDHLRVAQTDQQEHARGGGVA